MLGFVLRWTFGSISLRTKVIVILPFLSFSHENMAPWRRADGTWETLKWKPGSSFSFSSILFDTVTVYQGLLIAGVVYLPTYCAVADGLDNRPTAPHLRSAPKRPVPEGWGVRVLGQSACVPASPGSEFRRRSRASHRASLLFPSVVVVVHFGSSPETTPDP